MRVTEWCLISALLLLGGVHFAKANLPPGSQEILDKLKQFEEEQLESVQQKVGQKRLAVAESLKSQSVSETKLGNLDQANAINDCRLQLEDSSIALADVLESNTQLPGEARALLVKLVEYDQEERSNSKSVLNEKRSAVIEILEGHLKQAMQQGNLDAANALKTSIEGTENSLSSPLLEVSGTPTDSPQIPQDAIRHEGRYYKIYKMDRLITWEQARKECQRLGGELGWIDGPDGVNMVQSLMKPFLDDVGHAPIWVGGRRNRAGDWEWLDGTKLENSFWADGEDSWKQPENAFMMRWVGLYRASANDAPQPKGYLCQWE